MVKKHPDKTIAVSGIVLGHVPLALLAIIFLPMPSLKSLPYILASAIIHQGYQWYLLSAYKIGDFTKVYPICRGFGPIIATVISLIFLGVVFDLPILFSILLISFGIMLLGLKSESNNNFDIIKYSLLTGCFIGTYSIIDGYGARISLSAISYMSWSFVLNALMFPFLLKLRNETKIISRIFKNGNRLDLAEKEQEELKIAEQFLPAQLSENEIKDIVINVIKDLNATQMSDMGKVMKAVIDQTKGNADGKLISTLVRESLI